MNNHTGCTTNTAWSKHNHETGIPRFRSGPTTIIMNLIFHSAVVSVTTICPTARYSYPSGMPQKKEGGGSLKTSMPNLKHNQMPKLELQDNLQLNGIAFYVLNSELGSLQLQDPLVSI